MEKLRSGALEAEVLPRKVCVCGTVVYEGRWPKYSENVRCMTCGRDHSRQPPLLWLFRFARKRFRRWRRAYGLLSAVRHWRKHFCYRGAWKATVEYETPNPSVAPAEPITLIDGTVMLPGLLLRQPAE